MKSLPVFSIVVPIYKVEEYLERCVCSLVKQTYENIEIILVDDGSPDACPEMCDTYARDDNRVRVIHKPNGGPSDARNVGIDAATGEYIMFVDSDDYIDLDTCERLLPFTMQGFDILIGDGMSAGVYKKLKHGWTSESCGGMQYLKIALQHGSMPMVAWLYVYRKEFLLKNSLCFKKGIIHEDEEFIPRAFLIADRVIETGVCFYHYIVREGSITTSKDMRKNCSDLYNTCIELKAIYSGLEDTELKRLLIDSLVVKYLSLFQAGRLYRYGKEYIHKKFVRENAYSRKTKLKAVLFSISPRLYWSINYLTKL